MKKNLLEFALGSLEIIEERKNDKGDKELAVNVLFQHGGIINSNGRLYRKELLQREIDKLQVEIDSGKNTVWGHAFHPQDGLGKAQDISHRWNKVWMENDGKCYGEITILPTEAGKNVQTLVRAGKLGLSSRGFGSTTEREDIIDGQKVKYLEINDDYSMKSPGDFVVAPSVIGAGNLNEEIVDLESQLNGALIPEDKKKEENVKNKKKGYSLERLEEIMLDFFKRDKDFRGSFAQWKEKYALPIYAREMKKQGICETVEEGLKMINAGVEKKEPRKKVLPKDVFIEAKIGGMSAIKMAEKINKNIDKEIEQAKNSLTIEQRVKILAEADNAGINIHDSEERKRVLETAKKQQGKVTVEKPKPISEAKRKELLMREKITAGYRNSLFEPEKNKG